MSGKISYCFMLEDLEAERDHFMKDPLWWQKTIIYQIFPWSFKDSNGDGVGDLQGIISKLDYLSYLNVQCIWLCPIYKSPKDDHGYDISDFKEVDPTFGSLQDFDQLIEEAHSRGIKVLMDWVANHTSVEHFWFQESRKSRTGPYADYYVWSDGYQDEKGGHWPPNNWKSVMGNSIWQWCEERRQFYLHQFMPQMPDLNYRNAQVCQEMEDALAFWLDRGVDGFRIDAIKHLFESENVYQDEELTMRTDVPPNHYETVRHRHSIDLPEVHNVVRSWRRLLDKYQLKDGLYRCLVSEIFEDWGTNINDVMEHYDNGTDAPFCFRLCSRFNKFSGGWSLKHMIEEWIYHPKAKWPIWVVSNHDFPRVADKFGPEFVNAINTLLLLLPGTPCCFQGEEIGMRGKRLSFEETRDRWCKIFGPDHYQTWSRDPSRGPMLWDSSPNAGFCPEDVEPWLPLQDEFALVNVDTQRYSKEMSPLQFFRELTFFRKNVEFSEGSYSPGFTTENIYGFIRWSPPRCWVEENNDYGLRYDVIINVGHHVECFDTPANRIYFYNGRDFPDVHDKPKVVLHSHNLRHEQLKALNNFPFVPLNVYPGQAFVFRSRPKVKPDIVSPDFGRS